MEWRPGPRGHIAWFYDDVFIWSIAASSLGEYSSCDPANFGGRCDRSVPALVTLRHIRLPYVVAGTAAASAPRLA